jgi:hypothetical protein
MLSVVDSAMVYELEQRPSWQRLGASGERLSRMLHRALIRSLPRRDLGLLLLLLLHLSLTHWRLEAVAIAHHAFLSPPPPHIPRTFIAFGSQSVEFTLQEPFAIFVSFSAGIFIIS